VSTFSLLKCVEQIKLSLVQKSRQDVLTSLEEEQLAFFRQRGAIYLVVAAIAACLETFLGQKYPTYFTLVLRRRTCLQKTDERRGSLSSTPSHLFAISSVMLSPTA
jgi:hypothetical protein